MKILKAIKFEIIQEDIYEQSYITLKTISKTLQSHGYSPLDFKEINQKVLFLSKMIYFFHQFLY